MARGIDISKHQGSIDFSKVKQSGIDFVVIRSSYRQTTDIRFLENVRGCIASGIDILGIYHFVYALNDTQILEEAKYCVDLAESAGLSKEIYIFCDFEYDTVKKASISGVSLGKAECNRFTKMFCDYVLSRGYKTGIYTNLDYYKHWYSPEVLSSYPIWLADYNGEPDFKCIMQQYTSSGSVLGINGNVDMNLFFGDDAMEQKSRQVVVDLISSWLGKNEADGSFKEIVDIYNSYTGKFPRGIKMEYSWSWCACTWSAVAIKLGYTDIMPIEISCGYLIEAAKKMGVWQENDAYIPKPGDAVLYDWQDVGKGDNVGWPDHVGIVTEVYESAGYFIVIEGNYKNAVKKRTVSINGKYIRGFITPKYTDELIVPSESTSADIASIVREVIAGKWGSGEKRKTALVAAGYDYAVVQKQVNKILNENAKQQTATQKNTVQATCVAKNYDKAIAGKYITTADLYCRNDAGTNKKALCLIPKGTEVQCFGYYNISGGIRWYLVQSTINSTEYIGFSSSRYLKK